MPPINDGGAAYPMGFMWPNGQPEAQYGMSLRDHFAGQAMASMVMDTVADEAWETYEQLARDAYRVADAMLAARERES